MSHLQDHLRAIPYTVCSEKRKVSDVRAPYYYGEERMRPEIRVRRIGAQEWPLWRKLRLAAVEEAPYAFGSRLCDWQGDGDTEIRWRGRLSSVPLNVIAAWNERAAGMVSATARNQDGTVEAALRVALAVSEGNEHAVTLYRRHGFVDARPVAGSSSGSPTERHLVLDLVATLAKRIG